MLSPSSQGDDEGDKRQDFQSLATLRAYVLVSQDQRRVKVYRRGERGDWMPDAEVYRDGERFELPRLTEAILVSELYDTILDPAGRSLLR